MAATPVQGLTAWGLMQFVAGVRPGDVVLLHAAAGGVGHLAVQLARRAGARVLGTVSTDEKAAMVRRLGAEPLLYGDDLAARVRAATDGRGVDVVLDSVGRATYAVSLDCVAAFGQVIFFGDASGPVPAIDVEALYARSTRVGAFNLRLDDDPVRWAAAKRELVDVVASQALSVEVSRTLPLAAAAGRTTRSSRGRQSARSCCCRPRHQAEPSSSPGRDRDPNGRAQPERVERVMPGRGRWCCPRDRGFPPHGDPRWSMSLSART